MPREIQPWQLHAILEHQPAGRGHDARGTDDLARRTGRDLAEVMLRQRKGARRLDGARDCQRGVARVIVRREKRLHLVQCRRSKVVGAANRQPVIRMVGRIERRQHRHRRAPVRAVLVVLASLVEDDVALVVEFRVGERRQEVAHAVGLEPEREFHRSGGDHLPVVRAVCVCRAVEDGASGLQRLEVAAVVMRRPFEHQVFEQVGQPRAPGTLILRADVVPQVHRDQRATVIFVNEHCKAVVEHTSLASQIHVMPGSYRTPRRHARPNYGRA